MTRRIALAAVLLFATALSAHAQAVKVEFLMGKVNLSAQNASVRAILTEWARVGGSRIVNPERLVGPPVTLQLTGVPERQALDILLRDVGGYMLGPRAALVPGVSAYDRIVVVSAVAGRPAAIGPVASPTPQPVRRLPAPIFELQNEADDPADADEIVDDPASAAPSRPGNRPTPVGVRPGLAPPADAEPQPAPPTAPARGNPFGGVQGSARPGEIAPVPPRPTPNTDPVRTRPEQD